MLKAVLPLVPRTRPTKTYKKYLKSTWKPTFTDTEQEWIATAARYLRHYANLRPDAFTPLSGLNAYFSRNVPEADPAQLLEVIKNDRRHRFDIITSLDRVENEPGWHNVPYIRARAGHLVPDTRITTTRVELARSIPSLIYIASPERWHFIEKHGLRPDPPTRIKRLRRNPNFIYFAQHLTILPPNRFAPYTTTPDEPDVRLHIRVDVAEAMNAGINFFRTKTGQIISMGLRDHTIPPAFFKDVFVVSMKQEMLYHRHKPAVYPGMHIENMYYPPAVVLVARSIKFQISGFTGEDFSPCSLSAVASSPSHGPPNTYLVNRIPPSSVLRSRQRPVYTVPRYYYVQ
ncbi:hypothetical protein P691DRAFT_779294 [Macrolepiota fuliginosa MF-IS2]|uniref:Uncharacterized protein n=1 Tax=Macrolepiota fuliginosa MF-IS2 TaxID=1400762 RepID=A0A9P6BW97_9AGAR|nr:hypothetical protein P691DRAFT_779294 [Macrolepiota fuliginosa MF-IS2]